MNKPPSEPPANKSFRETLGIAISLIDKSLKGESPPLAKQLLDLNQENANLITRLEFLESRNNILTSQVDFLMNLQANNSK